MDQSTQSRINGSALTRLTTAELTAHTYTLCLWDHDTGARITRIDWTTTGQREVATAYMAAPHTGEEVRATLPVGADWCLIRH